MSRVDDLAYIVANGGTIQISASDFSTHELLYIASQRGRGQLMIFDDGSKSVHDMVLLAANGAAIIDTGRRSAEDAVIIATNKRG